MAKKKNLRNTYLVASTHDDFEIVASLEVGYDIFDNFVVHYYIVDYDGHRYDEHTYAIVDRSEVHLLADFLETTPDKLPCEFSDSYEGVDVDDVYANSSDIRAAFQSALEFILESGAHYRLEQ